MNYLNTKPLIYGLERHPATDYIDLVGAYPSRLAKMLADDEVDVGLIPVAAMLDMPGCSLVGNYCIAAEGEIASVCLFSEVSLEKIQKVYLDYQSRTSVALLRWLMKEYWGINPEIIQAENEGYIDLIGSTTAGLVIGDRALLQRKKSTFIYDLGSEWKAATGLPFVFAAWVSKKPMDSTFISIFNEANALGLNHIDEIAASIQPQPFDMKKYYSLHLSYRLDDRKKAGLDYFLKVISELNASR